MFQVITFLIAVYAVARLLQIPWGELDARLEWQRFARDLSSIVGLLAIVAFAWFMLDSNRDEKRIGDEPVRAIASKEEEESRRDAVERGKREASNRAIELRESDAKRRAIEAEEKEARRRSLAAAGGGALSMAVGSLLPQTQK